MLVIINYQQYLLNLCPSRYGARYNIRPKYPQGSQYSKFILVEYSLNRCGKLECRILGQQTTAAKHATFYKHPILHP